MNFLYWSSHLNSELSYYQRKKPASDQFYLKISFVIMYLFIDPSFTASHLSQFSLTLNQQFEGIQLQQRKHAWGSFSSLSLTHSWISFQLSQFPNTKCHIFPTIRWCLWFIVKHFKKKFFFYFILPTHNNTTLRLVRSGRNKNVTQRIFTKRNQKKKWEEKSVWKNK